jgi:cytochrome P450
MVCESPTPVTIGDKEYILPAKSWLRLQFRTVQTLEKHWSPDPEAWRPNRWINAPQTTPSKDAVSASADRTIPMNHKQETIKEAYKGTFVPWSEGPRICPGQKFARVEFVAVLATLFRRHRVRPAPIGSETQAQARARAWEWANDARTIGVALKLYRPNAVNLIWEKA